MRASCVLGAVLLLAPASAPAQPECVDCHREITPGGVADWELSAHHELDIGCADCHGDRRRHRQHPEEAR